PTVIPFRVDQNTGALTRLSPYHDPDNRAITAFAATPDGEFLFASETEGNGTNSSFFLQTLAVDNNSGALSATGTVSAVSAGEGIAVDPTGTCLAVGGNTIGTLAGNPAVGVYKIGSNGGLTLASGSPMPVFGTHVAGLAWDATGNFFYASSTNFG